MARIKRYNSETGRWEYCNTGGMPIKGIDYLTKADYEAMRAEIDAYLERNNESVGVTVSGNQGTEDVIGALVRIVDQDGSVIDEKVWNGTELVFRPEAGTVYHVEADASGQGFSSYRSGSFTAVKGGTRAVKAYVYAEKVNVGIEGIDTGFTVVVKEEYAQVEYIESTGSQYVDTGFKPNQNSKIVIDFHSSGASSLKCLAGVRVSNGDDCFLFWITDSVVYPQFADNGYNMYPVSANTQQRVIYTMDKNVASVNGSSVTMTSSTFQSNNSIYLFVCNDNGVADTDFSSGRLYSCQIYDNGTLVRDYIPVRNGSGVYGLYDKVYGVFYSSATSTAFTGPEVQYKTFLTLTETGGSCIVPYGTVYSVSATAVDGYVPPSSQIFTAGSAYRNVVMTYEESLLGVFIEDINGKLWKTDAWDGSETPNGVAVCTEDCRFVMALEDAYGSMCYWGGYQTTVGDIVSTGDSSVAIGDYEGEGNTTTIINTLSGVNDGYAIGAPAAEYCRAYIFPGGSIGYMGAAGEWQAALNNKSAIVYALSVCGGTEMSGYYWTSTQSSYLSSWCMYWAEERLRGEYKYSSNFTRAFTVLKRDTN